MGSEQADATVVHWVLPAEVDWVGDEHRSVHCDHDLARAGVHWRFARALE